MSSITFFQIFNRDEPDREKLVHVTVKATDNGRPQLEDICTLAVKIKDKNDNSPVFDRASYDVPIAQVIFYTSSCTSPQEMTDVFSNRIKFKFTGHPHGHSNHENLGYRCR